MVKKYDYFLFDLDGTLIDTTDLILACFRHSLSTVDIVKPDNEITNTIGLPLREQFELYVEDKSVNIENLMKLHMDHQLTIWKQYVKLLPNVKKILYELRDKKCAIVTSRRVRTASLYTEYLGIDSEFEVFITPESTTKHKPNPEPVLKAIEEIKAIPERTLFVGDSIFDILAGKSANVDTYLVEWEKNTNNSTKDSTQKKSTHKEKLKQSNPTYHEKNLNRILNLCG